jgi:hypothetical protein
MLEPPLAPVPQQNPHGTRLESEREGERERERERETETEREREGEREREKLVCSHTPKWKTCLQTDASG